MRTYTSKENERGLKKTVKEKESSAQLCFGPKKDKREEEKLFMMDVWVEGEREMGAR